MSNPTTKFHPILFSTPMIQAILEGKKTQTRRVVKLPRFHLFRIEKQIKMLTIKDWILYDGNNENIGTIKENYKVGDVLWARETWRHSDDLNNPFDYKADFELEYNQEHMDFIKGSWKPSIHMYKDACRIFLKVKSVKIERLNDISEEDAKKEGVVFENLWQQFDCYLCPTIKHKGTGLLCNDGFFNTAKESFSTLWESIFGHGTWEFNPYVFVYEYERIEKPLDFIV